ESDVDAAVPSEASRSELPHRAPPPDSLRSLWPLLDSGTPIRVQVPTPMVSGSVDRDADPRRPLRSGLSVRFEVAHSSHVASASHPASRAPPLSSSPVPGGNGGWIVPPAVMSFGRNGVGESDLSQRFASMMGAHSTSNKGDRSW